jgi:hypothetical protein
VQTAKSQQRQLLSFMTLQIPTLQPGGRGHATSGEQNVNPGPQNPGLQLGDWAKAGVLMLLRTGADQTMAVPAPRRLRSRLREIGSCSSMEALLGQPS